MDDKELVDSLGALAHAHRLGVVRLLRAAGPDGLSAGEIAQRLGVPPSSLSFHLRQMEQVGLLSGRRDQRNIIYRVEPAGLQRVLDALQQEVAGTGQDREAANAENGLRASA